MEGYLRGQIATLAGVNIETIRYYEHIQLIPQPARNESGYRIYSNETVVMLQFIKQAKECGFSLEEIQHLFSYIMNADQCLDNSNQLITNKLHELDHKINELQKMKETLKDIEHNVNSGNCSYFTNMI